MVTSPLFNILITVLIIANTYLLASYRYDESLEDAEFKSKADFFFVAAFSLEIILKVIGLGFKEFITDSFNKFDAFIVTMSYVEIILTTFVSEGPLSTVLLSLRAMRAIRMLKLARFNEGMRQVLNQTMQSMKNIGGFSMLLALFLFIWALMGMELFAYLAIYDQQGNIMTQEQA